MLNEKTLEQILGIIKTAVKEKLARTNNEDNSDIELQLSIAFSVLYNKEYRHLLIE
jgi:hypothetical protein